MRTLTGLLLVAALVTTVVAADRDSVSQSVRTELATLLKKDAAKLPFDKPIVELGVDDLTVVEWVMALERTFRIRIANDRTIDPKTKATRRDLTIARMTAVVLEELERSKSKRK